MGINEIFPNPTVKQVVFQIRFPNLFYIESKIGELQTLIYSEFPESALLYSKLVSFGNIGPDVKNLELDWQKIAGENGGKIWQFKSPKNFELNITPNSIDITSNYHKTYRNEGGEKFRDIIKFTVDNFIKVVPIPRINRVGLRYIDECPITTKDTDSFIKYYNSTLPVNRFKIEDALNMNFRVNSKMGKYFVNYAESLLDKGENKYSLIIDLDGYGINIMPEIYLNVTDELHDVITEEYMKTIKEPVYEFMRKKE